MIQRTYLSLGWRRVRSGGGCPKTLAGNVARVNACELRVGRINPITGRWSRSEFCWG